MKKMWAALFILMLLLQACGTKDEPGTEKSNSNGNLPPLQAEVKEGDFTYKLYSEKESYKKFEEIEVYAEIIYTGQGDSIDIYHAASPFYFPFEELTRGYNIPYSMPEPLITTTIKKNEPFIKKYAFAGGYSDQEDPDYVNFVKTVINDGFPEGEYIIHGTADFWTQIDDNITKYQLNADIGFIVEE